MRPAPARKSPYADWQTLNIQKLIKMANQIADNFYVGDDAAAVAGTADHLTRFWSLEMKKQIVAHFREESTGLNQIAEAAVRKLAENEKYAA